jgi:hypothetical protein
VLDNGRLFLLSYARMLIYILWFMVTKLATSIGAGCHRVSTELIIRSHNADSL